MKPAERVISLGSLCLTSTLLKSMDLKPESYPFDWLFSSPAMVAHCLDDDFTTLLDKSQYVPIADGRGPQARHLFYNEFARRLGPVFNHHNPAESGDYAYLERCVARFRLALISPWSLFLLIRDSRTDDVVEFETLAAALRRRVDEVAMLFLAHRQDPDRAGEVTTVRSSDRCVLVEVWTGTPVTYGTRFVDPADDVLLRTVIRDATTWSLTPRGVPNPTAQGDLR